MTMWKREIFAKVVAQRHSSSFPFDALLWTLSEFRVMLLQKHCSQKKPMITKAPDMPHRNKPWKKTVGRNTFITPFMNHWDRYVPKAELVNKILRAIFVFRNSLIWEQNDNNLFPTTERTTLQQHCHYRVCVESFIPKGEKCLFLQPCPYSPQTPCHELKPHWTTALFQPFSCHHGQPCW